jgi:3-oxoacyl-[acyl-carrier-protein] synthase-1
VIARASVVGGGARTALGRSLGACAAAVRARVGNVGPHPFFSNAHGRRMSVARAAWLPDRLIGGARLANLARNATKEALASIDRGGEDARVRAFVGVAEPRPGAGDEIVGEVMAAVTAGAAGRLEGVSAVRAGHAGSLVAIEQALSALERGDADLCLAGGVDSWLDLDALEWLAAEGRIHDRRRPYGFIPGEGAAFCLLASPRWLAARGVTSVLGVVAAASAVEPAPRGSSSVCVGKGLGAAFAGALAPLRARAARVTRMIGDLNGEPHRVDELGFAVARCAESLARPGDVTAPSSLWGDIGAASGAAFVGLALEAARRGSAPQRTLIWGSSEDGARAAVTLESHPPAFEEESS